jgi:protein O-mannosyl-transferase
MIVPKLVEAVPKADRGRGTASRADLTVGLALVLLTVAVLGPVCRCDFVNYDDDVYVTNNLGVLQGVSPEGIRWAFATTLSNHWHPLTWLSLQRDVDLYADADGLHAWGFHLTNLLLHVGNVLLLYAVLRQTTGQLGRSAIVAAIFAIHPLHVESVAWVTERKDVLSTFFWMLTTLAYVAYARSPAWWRYTLVLVPYALGLLAKPMLMTLPFTLLLLDYWPLRRTAFGAGPTEGSSFRPAGMLRLVLEKLPLFAMAAASLVVSLAARNMGGGIKSGEYLSVSDRLGCAINAAVVYVFKIIYPIGLAPFYPLPPGAWTVAPVAVETALLIVASILALRAWKARPYLTVGWLWYLGTLLPVSGVVQLGSYAYADRYAYVPTIGLYIVVVWGLADLVPGGIRLSRVLTATALLLLALLSARQVRFWQNSVSLWEHAREVTPDNFVARTHLGLAYQADGRVDEAEEELAAALAIRPDLAVASDNLGVIKLRRGRLAEAEACFREARQREPHELRYHVHLVEALKREGKTAAADEEFRALYNVNASR